MLIITLFFFNDTATTEIYTLSLHDALPIFTRIEKECDGAIAQQLAQGHRRSVVGSRGKIRCDGAERRERGRHASCSARDRKSTRLNSSHDQISYAVFCLKKKKNNQSNTEPV